MVGYSVLKKESLNPIYICPYCSLLLRDPVQLIDCGHRLCQSCADEQKGDVIICYTCQQKTSRQRLLIDRGFKKDMQTLSILCSLCEWIDILKNYQNHLDQIHPNPTCNYCGEKFLSVDQLNRHQQFICEKITMCCPFKEFGCKGIIPRINLSEHYRSDQHQKTIMNIACHLKSLTHSEMSSQRTTDLSHTMKITTNESEEINETFAILTGGVEALKDDIQRLRAEPTNYQHELESLTPEFSKLKISIQEQNTALDDLEKNQEILQQDIVSMQEKVNDIKSRSFDGIFIWKLTNVQEKLVAARSETQSSFYSPPFYSSAAGYKMCVRLYLNGDGNARGTHMSLFFVLMRGEYDAILKFPFNFKVIFCLYDQINQRNHIIDAFRPDIRSNSFQRPRSDMNIASGIPKFVDLKILQQENNPYIRDDTMFIKVIIDYNDMSKAILSYALNLNPGLTASIQQTMIQQEMEKN